MSTSPLNLLTLAKKLQVEASDEASLRCAVSRAYYAALLRADSTFEHHDSDVQHSGGASSHERIIARAQLHGKGANPGRSYALNVAKLLPKMKRARVKADYELDVVFTKIECDDVVIKAESVLAFCDEIELKINQAENIGLEALAGC